MPSRELAGLILASAVITLDGTAVTVALPAIARDLSMPVSSLQWISNAPLLMLAALLLPAGAAADRVGRVRTARLGVAGFAVASGVCAAAQSDGWLIAARMLQGACGALVLPAVLAVLRGAYADAAERTRRFGTWAAWTGVASAAGPLLGGGLSDVASWRAVFGLSVAVALAAALLIPRSAPAPSMSPADAVPLIPSAALAVLLGAAAYLLIEGPAGQWRNGRLVLAALLVPAAVWVLARSRHRHVLLPPELIASRNCLPANAATFALYFGMFGLSFLLVLYTQQVLDYSGMWAAVALLPVSVMLLLARHSATSPPGPARVH